MVLKATLEFLNRELPAGDDTISVTQVLLAEIKRRGRYEQAKSDNSQIKGNGSKPKHSSCL